MAQFAVRPAAVGDAGAMAKLFGAVAEERIGIARDQGLHKLCLEVFAHNTAAIAVYRRCGFVEEGHRVRHYRRASGELWDSIVMGLPL